MKLNTKALVTDYEGKQIDIPAGTEENPEATKPLTYFEVIINSLNGAVDSNTLTAEKKNEIYQLSKKLYASKEPNLTAEQLTLVKERVGKCYSAMVYGKVCDLIDGVEDVKPESTETPPAPESSPAN